MSNNPYNPTAVGAGRPVQPEVPTKAVQLPFPAPQPERDSGPKMPESRAHTGRILPAFQPMAKLLGQQLAAEEHAREAAEETAFKGKDARAQRLHLESLADAVKNGIQSEESAKAEWAAKWPGVKPEDVAR
jgi:hypothetical protein